MNRERSQESNSIDIGSIKERERDVVKKRECGININEYLIGFVWLKP
jgi:hypothetical protein